MHITDPVSDLITRIRNAQKNRFETVSSPSSKFRLLVLDVLKREGFIKDFKEGKSETGHMMVTVELKYSEPGNEPVIKEITRVSKPGRRVYSGIEALPKVYNGLGVSILSTSKGVMSDHEAREANVGGEVLFKVF
ncbi:MAG: 30S ribosomal protein S8 [Candidatus Nucleicultricaceae bacterium]